MSPKKLKERDFLGAVRYGLPAGYKRLEYLEATGSQHIKMNGLYDKHTGLRLEAETFAGSGNVSCVYFMTQNHSAEKYWWVFPPRANRDNHSLWEWYWFGNFGAFTGFQLASRYVATINYRSANTVTIEQNGTVAAKELPEPLDYSSTELKVISSGWKGRCYSVQVSRNTTLENIFIPALDSTGAPCMYDIISQEPFYNSGTGDFIYPNMATQASTYSLRNRMYAQMTECGIRRLYHVPEGCEMSKEEYADKYGFKLLVETPAPEEGYWTPVWHDRVDYIELEWVETAPPDELITE